MRQSHRGRKSSRRVATKARKARSRRQVRAARAHGRGRTAMKARRRVALEKTQAKPHRHVASPATVREIAQSLGLTAKDLAAGSLLVDRLGL